jgi:hypothetical protein
MKKTFFITVFILVLSMGLFAQVDATINTSEGTYDCAITYNGVYKGQEVANTLQSLTYYPRERTKPSEGQWQCVYKMLERYKKSTGDTFTIRIDNPRTGRTVVSVTVEYTSDTKSIYWAFRPLY